MRPDAPFNDPYQQLLDTAESFYDGTWASGRLPDELVDFELIREFGWTWQELQETPVYVRRFAWDFLSIQREVAHAQAKRAAVRAARG